jgi:arylsulfatase A-like enzyme
MATSTPAKPNILFVMADDVGWFNIGAYHRGMMAGRTPNLDRLASEGMMFTDTMLRRAALRAALIL